jgi:hypothetical protein
MERLKPQVLLRFSAKVVTWYVKPEAKGVTRIWAHARKRER